MKKSITKTVAGFAALVLLIVALRAYLGRGGRLTKHTDSFFDTFDTVITVVAYTNSENQFRSRFEAIHERFRELHRLYDIYNDYPGISNIKTINDNAGKKPIAVNKEIIDLILFAKDWHGRTGGLTNIAMGSVLRIWHDYRQEGMDDPEAAEVPPMSDLVEAAKHTDLGKVIVDAGKGTVYLEDPKMSLDVGAVAKGYATELVAQELAASGMKSVLLSSGGNIRAIGKPLDGVRERWGVGIQNPDAPVFSDEENLLDVVFVKDTSVASSGGYQRYYVVDGKILHHIIDPKTLMPADYVRAVTVKTKDAGIADFLSTTLFLMPLEEGRALAESLEDVEVVWVLPDGQVSATPGMEKVMKSKGATGAGP